MSCYHSSFLPCLSPISSTNKCFWSHKKRNSQLGWAIRVKCNAFSKPTSQDYKDLLENEVPPYKTQLDIVEDDVEGLVSKEVNTSSRGISAYVERIRGMLKWMDDGEISISPYDTAWVALVKSEDGSPLFPSSLQWIVDNQLPDGSWGDHLFEAHDRIINTLACVIALKSWNLFPDKCNKGLAFLKENISKMQDENAEHLPIGFEVAFPGLIEIAQSYGIEVPQDTPVVQEIYAQRNEKLKRIPKEIMHNMATTLLHSLEGMSGLDWEKLLKLQSKDGSFLFSPASTAYALMQTKDANCFHYLNRIVQRFNGGAPNVYPVDLFEHMWVVDRLQRLGISRFFQDEIAEFMSYINRYWTERGVGWARNSEVQDIDDTSMAFRLLRLHGYQVSADVFKNFEKDGKFFCFVGQSNQAVTGMYNLFRASQLQFSGEEILQNARNFSSKFLREKEASNQLLDKWIIAKDLHGEVTYALNVPWYANLPRIQARFYIDQYGGGEEAWIGKTIYRMPKVSSNIYLELAKLDYDNIQALHIKEWNHVLRWHSENNLRDFGVSESRLLIAYFVAVATLFEPEKAKERLAWAKTAILLEAIDSEFTKEKASLEERRDFVNQIQQSYINQGYLSEKRKTVIANKKGENLVDPLLSTLDQLSTESVVIHGADIRNHLFHAWGKWLTRWEEEGDRLKGEAELLVHTIEFCAGRWTVSDVDNVPSAHPNTLSLLDITNRLCSHFAHLHNHHNKVQDLSGNEKENKEVEVDLQKMTELVLTSSVNGVNSCLKQTCLALLQSYFYTVYCSPEVIHDHIDKVLFQKVY